MWVKLLVKLLVKIQFWCTVYAPFSVRQIFCWLTSHVYPFVWWLTAHICQLKFPVCS